MGRAVVGHGRFRIGVIGAIAAAWAGCGPEPFGAEDTGSWEAPLTQVSSFGSNPGGLAMYAYSPAGVPAHAPVVVALHGCTMSASAYVGAGWNQLADLWTFHVVYPQTTKSNSCFSWFDASQTRRGAGEALSIKQMVDYAITTWDADPARVFVTGLSAGGGMTAAMLATYPDVFAAGAPVAGLPYKCADTLVDATSCMTPGRTQTASAWGDLVRAADQGFPGPWPRVSIWQGASDYTVATKNLTELAKQWTNVHAIDATADATEKIGPGNHSEFRGTAGTTLVETWSIDSMGHGTPVDPGNAAAGGCGTAGAFILDVNLCSTLLIGRFFGLEPGGSVTDGGTPVDAGPAPVDAGPTPVDAGPSPEDAGPVDAGPTPVDAGPTPVDAGPTFTCREWDATNYDQVVAGRAERCGSGGSYVCTIGSNENLGLWNTFARSWIREVAPGYYQAGRCADAPPFDGGSPVDAGPAEVDAGSPEEPDAGESVDAGDIVDAGDVPEGDAGPVAVDSGSPVDSGTSSADASTPPTPDAGPVVVDAGDEEPEPKDTGCGCQAAGPNPWFAAIALGWLARRRR